jgi:hypothetical protein
MAPARNKLYAYVDLSILSTAKAILTAGVEPFEAAAAGRIRKV